MFQLRPRLFSHRFALRLRLLKKLLLAATTLTRFVLSAPKPLRGFFPPGRGWAGGLGRLPKSGPR
jgi:hypothetical protein